MRWHRGCCHRRPFAAANRLDGGGLRNGRRDHRLAIGKFVTLDTFWTFKARLALFCVGSRASILRIGAAIEGTILSAILIAILIAIWPVKSLWPSFRPMRLLLVAAVIGAAITTRVTPCIRPSEILPSRVLPSRVWAIILEPSRLVAVLAVAIIIVVVAVLLMARRIVVARLPVFKAGRFKSARLRLLSTHHRLAAVVARKILAVLV